MDVVRAFLALEVSKEIKENIIAVEEEISRTRADIKLVEYENLHVTMKFLGDIAQDTIERVGMVMSDVKGERFTLEVRGTGVFPNHRMLRVLWVGTGQGSENVISLFNQLDSRLNRLGFGRERDFVPHITIGRVKSQRDKEALLNVMNRNKNRLFGNTCIDRILLKKSILSASGPIYSDLREATLGKH